jgi:uncharacterized repeat protein (TIGR01451 family)/fimbrial isopeptide formation D2 family protein
MKDGYTTITTFCVRLIALLTSILGLRAPSWLLAQDQPLRWRSAPPWQRRLLPVLVFGMAFWALPQVVQAQQLTLLKSVSDNMVQSGETITFTLSFGCTSETENCTMAELTDVLPDFLEVVEPLPCITIESVEDEDADPVDICPIYDEDERIITWNFSSILPEMGLPDGTSFEVTYQATVIPGDVPDGAIITNMATITGDGSTDVSSEVDIAVMAEPKWELSKSKVGTRPIYHDEEVTYQIVIDPVSPLGNTNLTDVEVVDVLPVGAELVLPVPAGATYDEPSRTLTWNFAELDVTNGPVTLDVTVVFPYTDVMGEPNFTGTNPGTPAPKTNTVTMNGDIQGEDTNRLPTLMDTDDTPLSPPVFEFGIVKTAENAGNIPVGLTNTFNLGVSTLNSTREIDNFIVQDDIPDEFDLERIGFNGFPAGFPVAVTITLGDGSMQTLNVTTSDEIDVVNDFTLGSDYVDAITIDFGTVPEGFMGSIALSVIGNQDTNGDLVSNTGVPYAVGDQINNTATLNGNNSLDNSTIMEAMDSDDMCILPEFNTRVDPEKAVAINYVDPPEGDPTTGNPYFPGSRVQYTITVENDGPDGNVANFVTANTSTATLITPIVADLLPIEMTYDAGSATIVNNNAPNSMIVSVEPAITNNPDGTTLLVWTFDGNFAVGESLQIQFNATIAEETDLMAMVMRGDQVTNQYAIGSPDPSSVLTCGGAPCGETQTNVDDFFPEDSGITEFCSDSESFTIRFETAIPFVEKTNTTGSGAVFAPSGVSVPNTTNTVVFTTTFGNDPMASVPLPGLVAFDLLPPEVDYVPGSLTLLGSPANPAFNQPTTISITANVDEINEIPVVPAPPADDVFIEIIENYEGTDRTLIRWTFPETVEFPIADGVSYSFEAQIRPNESGEFSNALGISSPMFDDIDIECPTNGFTDALNEAADADGVDLDGDGNSDSDYCSTTITSPIRIIDVRSMSATKFVRGENDTEFLRPGPGSTNYNGNGGNTGIVDWQLEVSNPGNVTLEHVRVYDIFPYVGDVGVQNTGEDRDSEWRPEFFSFNNIMYDETAMLIEYSTSQNPCRSEIFIPPFVEPTGCDPNWTNWQSLNVTPDGDAIFGMIQAIRITFNNPLLPGEEFIIDIQQRAPEYPDTEALPGAIAWNSLARVASTDPTFMDRSALQVPPQEPNKVGVRLEALDLAVIKELCDTQERNVDPGETVCFDLTIINQGSTTVTSVTLHDYNEPDFDLVSSGWTPESDAAGLEVSSLLLTPDDGPGPGGLPDGGLAPGAQVVIQVEYMAVGTAPFGSTVLNRIEISAAEDEFGNTEDYDGTFDNIPLNDNGGTGADPADPTENNNVDGNAFEGEDEDNEDPSYVCIIELFAGSDADLCPNQALSLASLGSMVSPDPASTANFDVNWSTSGGGTFVQADGTTVDDSYNGAVFYIPSPADIVAQSVTLTLTTSNTVDGLCDDLTDDVVIRFLAGCGTFTADSGASCGGPANSPIDPAGRIDVTTTPLSFVAGNSQIYILAQANIVVAVSSGGSSAAFTSLAAGNYDVFAVNYDPADVANTALHAFINGLTVGDDISALIAGGSYPPTGIYMSACYQVCSVSYTVPNCYSVGSTVFIDNNNDGMFDQDMDGTTGSGSDEVGIEGIIVQLIDPADGSVLFTTMTDADGNYYFGGLDAGDYQINIPSTPEGYPNSSAPDVTTEDPNNGADNDDNGIQSGPGAATTSGVFTLGDVPEPTGDETGEGGDQDDTVVDGISYDENGDMTIDFGFVPEYTLGSYVWVDTDNNNFYNETEMGLNGVTLELYDVGDDGVLGGGDDMLVGTTTTAGGGEYIFTNLFPGQYVVVIPESNFDGGGAAENFPISSDDDTGFTNADNGTPNDDNGLQPLGPGTQIESPVIELAYLQEPTNLDDEGMDSVNPGDEQDDAAPRQDGNGDMTIDFGLVPTMSIGSNVFFDANDNAFRDPDETGIANVVVNLYADSDNDGVPDGPAIATTTTGPNGDYIFSGLEVNSPTNFIVGVVPPMATPQSSTDSPTNPPADNSFDNNDDGLQDMANQEILSPSITLTPGGETNLEPGSGGAQDNALDNQGDMTIDFGLIPIGSIGSTVFIDNNNNGAQDADDDGIPGIVVELYLADVNGEPDGEAIATTTTGANGDYIFENLLPGNYLVGIPTPPTAYQLSSQPTDSDDNVDGIDGGIQDAAGDPTFSGTIILTAGNEPTAGAGEDGTNGDQDNEVTDDPSDDSYGDMTVDFGFTPAVSVGSTVFIDLDNDGVQELAQGEIGILGVTVQLFAAGVDPTMVGAMPIAETVTDINGNYFFGGLPQGDYFIYIPSPADAYPISSTPTEIDGMDNTDGDDNGIQGAPGEPVSSPDFNLTADSEPTGTAEGGVGGNLDDNVDDDNGNMTFDFGFYPAMSIGSVVWVDSNNDGIYQEATESPLGGVVVELWSPGDDGQIGTADDVQIDVGPDGLAGTMDDNMSMPYDTDTDGTYFFGNLPPGDYYVLLPASNFGTGAAAEDFPTSSTPTNDDDDQFDNDDNGIQDGGTGTAIVSPVIELRPFDEPINEVGAGNDQDGQQSEGDPFDDNGDMTVDFGLIPTMAIGSTVFYDVNDDGTQNADNPLEAGIPDVTVSLLYDANGNGVIDPVEQFPIANTMTDEDGNYFFGGLVPGNYQVVVNPDDSAPTSSSATLAADDNGGDNMDNGNQLTPGDPATSPIIMLVGGTEPTSEPGPGGTQDTANGIAENNGDMTVDFGFIPNMSLGSTVFFDVDNSGDQDATNPLEVGLVGVTVNLYFDANGDGDFDDPDEDMPVLMDITDVNGDYLFTMLPPGNYQVGVIALAEAPVASTGLAVSDDPNDDTDGNSDGSTTAAAGDESRSGTVTLVANNEPQNDEEDAQGGAQDDAISDANGNMTVDFGFVPTNSVGSTVFYDFDDDGMQDQDSPLEAGIPGVTVELYQDTDGDGTAETLVGTTETNAMGNYFFGNLPNGDYQVVIPSAPDNAPVNSTEVDPDQEGVDANDDLENGVQTTPGGPTSSAVFTLMAGAETTDEDNQGGDQDDSLVDANGNMTIDFGFIPNQSIGSTVFADDNDNGIQDPDEPGLGNIRVRLLADLDGDGVIDDEVAETFTNPDGDYFFGGLPAGDYVVEIDPPADRPRSSTDIATTTEEDVDGDDTGLQPDGDDTPITSPVITLSPSGETVGETEQGGDQDVAADAQGNMNVDFGLVPIGSIGSTVFIDNDNNGNQDAGDDGIPGIVVELYLADVNGEPDGEAIATTTTGPDGDYIFENLLPGNYLVGIPTPPASYPLSSTGSFDDENEDNTDNGMQSGAGAPTISTTIVLTLGGEPTTGADPGDTENGTNAGQDDGGSLEDSYGDMTVDFGFIPAVSVGSTVWIDQNNNGVQDPGEMGIPEVTVELYSVGPDGNAGTADDVLVGTTDTDENGDYFFGDLVPGDYYLVIPTAPEDYPRSSSFTEDDPDVDIDSNDNGDQPGGSGTAVSSGVVTLSPGDEPEDSDTVPEGGQGTGQDEDDDDNGNMTVDFGFIPPFDLALTKAVTTPADGMVMPGDAVTFTITVENQGGIAATDIVVTDYVPAGMTFEAGLQPAGNAAGWAPATGNDVATTIPGPINPGAEATLVIVLRVDGGTDGEDLVNVAEIAQAEGPSGNILPDVDSSPDAMEGNDAGGEPGTPSDDATTGDGSGDPGDTEENTDEDDADPALVTVGDFDLALIKELADRSERDGDAW